MILSFYLDKSNVLQHFGNIRNNSVIARVFVWGWEGDEPHWTVWCWVHQILSKCYSPDLPLSLSTASESTVLGSLHLAFLQPSGYCTVINCTFIIHTINIFGRFDGVMAHLELIKHKFWRWPWCNGYRRWKWTWRHEFRSWTRLIAFHIALIPLGKVWIQLFSLHIWVNSRADWVLQPWWGN